MRIGIVADIHDAVGNLGAALRRFHEQGVERVVSLGDAFETYLPGEPGASLARALEGVGAVGVWGNHDFALSRDVPVEIERRADPVILRFAARFQPRLVLDDCAFSHIEPWRDPHSIEDLWSLDSAVDLAGSARRSFACTTERILVMGHLHRWFGVTADRVLDWYGERELLLERPRRFLIGMGAVQDGWCAVLDTDRCMLEPLWCGLAGERGGMPEQVAVVAYREGGGGPIEICLLRSRRNGAWGIPKGFVDPGDSQLHAAATEALEEAGLRGILDRAPAGVFVYEKWSGRYSVAVFCMRVSDVAGHFDEEHLRERHWMPPAAALRELASHPGRPLVEQVVDRLQRERR